MSHKTNTKTNPYSTNHNTTFNTHTHTHPFNGPFSGTTQVSRYQKGKTNLDFTEARDSEWPWHQLCHMQVCTSLQTDNHASTPPLSFLQAGCPSCRPTNSVKAHTHTHIRLTALFPGLPGWAGTRKVKPIWILLKQETASGNGISWAICKSAPRSRQITTPAPHHSVFYTPDALPAAQPTASKQWRHNPTFNLNPKTVNQTKSNKD